MPKKGYKQTEERRKKFCRPMREETKKKLSALLTGVKQKKRSEETKNKMRKPKSSLHVKHIKDARARQVQQPHTTPHKEITKLKLRVAILKNIAIRRNAGEPICARIGNNETKILNTIEKEQNIRIKRQHVIDGYFIDGYCVETNTAYEVDEAHHHTDKQKLKDKEREEYIKDKLDCKFIRLDEKECMQKVKDL